MEKYKIIKSNFSEINSKYSFGEYLQPYKQWVSFGEDNLTPNHLLNFFNGSGFHASIVKRKTDLISSKGWVETQQNKSFIDNLNSNDSLNDIVQKTAFDINLFGLSYLNVIYNATGDYISQVEHVSPINVRVSKNGEFKYLISKDWANYSRPSNTPIPIAEFNPEDKQNKSQILCVKEYVPGQDIYSLPDYFSSLKWVELDRQISIWHLSNINNNFAPSVVITYREGRPTSQEEEVLYKSIKDSFSGAFNAGDVLLTFSESPDSAPVITTINGNDSDSRYKDLMEIVMQQICSGHRLTSPELAGIQTPGKLSNASETYEAELRFKESVIEPKIKIIERAFSKISKVNSIDRMELIPVITKQNITDTNTEINIENK